MFQIGDWRLLSADPWTCSSAVKGSPNLETPYQPRARAGLTPWANMLTPLRGYFRMIEIGQKAPQYGLQFGPGEPCLLVFLETDCPTCRLTIPYLNRLAEQGAQLIGISQDSDALTRQFVEQTYAGFRIDIDSDLRLSRAYDPVAVPAFVLVGADGYVKRTQIGFDKDELNAVAEDMGRRPIADAHDGAPHRKPGCSSRHREPSGSGAAAEPLNVYGSIGTRASRIDVSEDPYDYCLREFGDPLPVIPPTVDRVERMMSGLDPAEII